MRHSIKYWEWFRPALKSLGWVLLRWLLASIALAVLGAIGAGLAAIYFTLKRF